MKKQTLQRRLYKLRKDIGDELYLKLSKSQRELIAKTSGTLYLGENVDIERMYKSIEG